MILYHTREKSIKVENASPSDKSFTTPSKSGTLATEEDVLSVTIPALLVKPVITFPLNESIDYENRITFTEYTPVDEYSGPATDLIIQIALDKEFKDLYLAEISTPGETDLYLPVDISKTKVYIRIRYISNKYKSPWSDIISVTTKEFKINIPTIITPTNNASNINNNIVISTSSFSYVGVTDTHESTTYQISTDINFNSIAYNTTSLTALLSITAAMGEGRTYYIRARHNGTRYGSSDWSSTVKVTTKSPPPPPPPRPPRPPAYDCKKDIKMMTSCLSDGRCYTWPMNMCFIHSH